jgi:hypothetical protein
MISLYIIIVLAAVLFLLLFFVGRGKESADDFCSVSREQIYSDRQDSLSPPKLVCRIFSQDDWEFISRLGSAQLNRVYQTERTKVAMHWVRQTTRSLREVMDEHALTSRESPNLEVSGEMKLFFQYIELRVICGFLIIFLRLAGPNAVGNLATYASQISHRISRARQEFAATEHSPSSESPSAP